MRLLDWDDDALRLHRWLWQYLIAPGDALAASSSFTMFNLLEAFGIGSLPSPGSDTEKISLYRPTPGDLRPLVGRSAIQRLAWLLGAPKWTETSMSEFSCGRIMYHDQVLKRIGIKQIVEDQDLLANFLERVKQLKPLPFPSERRLSFLVGSENRAKLYRITKLPKKRGGERIIAIPNRDLLWTQRRLLQVFTHLFPRHKCAHGFERRKSIVSHARAHARKKWVYCIDLKDFFPSINWGRLYGMFQAAPFNCPPDVARILTNLTTFEGTLPQGAPTSPVLSNLLCRRLDSRLFRWAREHGYVYTRYADDLAFSTNHDLFPEDHREQIDQIIAEEGFTVHPKKRRLMPHYGRQVVTGLIVNRGVNIPRSYIRHLRALLFNIRTFGWTTQIERLDEEWGDSDVAVQDGRRRRKRTLNFHYDEPPPQAETGYDDEPPHSADAVCHDESLSPTAHAYDYEPLPPTETDHDYEPFPPVEPDYDHEYPPPAELDYDLEPPSTIEFDDYEPFPEADFTLREPLPEAEPGSDKTSELGHSLPRTRTTPDSTKGKRAPNAGLIQAAETTRKRPPITSKGTKGIDAFRRVIAGQIAFVGMVRGRKDGLYLHLKSQLDELIKRIEPEQATMLEIAIAQEQHEVLAAPDLTPAPASEEPYTVLQTQLAKLKRKEIDGAGFRSHIEELSKQYLEYSRLLGKMLPVNELSKRAARMSWILQVHPAKTARFFRTFRLDAAYKGLLHEPDLVRDGKICFVDDEEREMTFAELIGSCEKELRAQPLRKYLVEETQTMLEDCRNWAVRNPDGIHAWLDDTFRSTRLIPYKRMTRFTSHAPIESTLFAQLKEQAYRIERQTGKAVVMVEPEVTPELYTYTPQVLAALKSLLQSMAEHTEGSTVFLKAEYEDWGEENSDVIIRIYDEGGFMSCPPDLTYILKGGSRHALSNLRGYADWTLTAPFRGNGFFQFDIMQNRRSEALKENVQGVEHRITFYQ